MSKVDERFDAKVDRTTPAGPWGDCHVWTASDNGKGYGQIRVAGKLLYAHILAWEFENGPVPPGHEVHHRCVNPPCVNEAHLEATPAEEHPDRPNVLNAAKTHCHRGHPFDSLNTGRYKGERVCRECGREKTRRYRQRAKARTT